MVSLPATDSTPACRVIGKKAARLTRRGGRRFGVEAVRAINRFATEGLEPDRTLLLRLDHEALRERQRVRAQAPDRLERESEEFFARIADTYDALAAAEPERIRVIDAAQ